MQQGQALLAAKYRVAQYYLDYLRSAQKAYLRGSESAAHALSLFDQEREQVKQWQAWAVAHSRQDDRAAALCSDFTGASPNLFQLRLLPQEYLSWLEAAVEAARRLGDRRAEAAHLLGQLSLYVTGELTYAYHLVTDLARQALSIAQQIDDQPLLARALALLGIACHWERKLEQAQAYFEQSLKLYRILGDQRGMAQVLNDLGTLAISRRENAAAQSYLEQSLALYKKVGDREGADACLANLGFVAIRLGNFSVASDYLELALASRRVIGDILGVSQVMLSLGNNAYYQGDYSLARNYFEQSLAIIRTAGFQDAEANCLYDLGLATMAQGDLYTARDYFEQGLIIARSMAEVSALLPNCLSSLAILYLQLHEVDRAFTTLREGLEAACRLPVETYKLKVLIVASRMWILKGKPLQAARWLGLVENHANPAVRMTDIKRDLRVARDECEAALSPEQFAAAWEEGKTLDLDSVVAETLSEL